MKGGGAFMSAGERGDVGGAGSVEVGAITLLTTLPNVPF